MYQRILVPIDGSDTSAIGLQEAIRLAKLTGGKLRVMHAIDDLSFALAMDAYAGMPGQWMDELRQEAHKLLAQAVGTAAEAGVPAESVLRERFDGKIVDAVVAEATSWPADLIVLGTHGRRGLSRLMMGSDAESILRMAPVPVLLVRPPAEAAPQEKPAGVKHVSLVTGALKIE
ncbi:universal stress protein [Variovorax dokdonensis]|uniref:Universal stress protein n=1 Tax=Variovorax dokdonensis TaxID=344883 RepID=A0ABT7NFQ4_9BURK|nr:universal stress protein [Variovorax dokdonensis]